MLEWDEELQTDKQTILTTNIQYFRIISHSNTFMSKCEFFHCFVNLDILLTLTSSLKNFIFGFIDSLNPYSIPRLTGFSQMDK